MKRKLFYGALVLPMVFAACTNDVFETAQVAAPDSSVLNGRAVGNVTLAAGKADVKVGGETRLAGSYENEKFRWYWTGSDDKLGAVVVDYAEDGEIVSLETYPAYVITNLPFAPQIENPSYTADFKTNTAVVQGAYMFYNQYDGTNTARRTISHTLPRIQKVDAGLEYGLQQIGASRYKNAAGEDAVGQNFFVSPIIDLAVADGNENKNPVSLVSAHAMMKMTIRSDVDGYYDKDFSIQKIVFSTVAESEKFQLSQTLDPAKIAGIQKTVGKNDENFKANGAILTEDYNGAAAAIGKVIEGIISIENNKISDISEYGSEESATSADIVYQLNKPYVFTSKNDVCEIVVVFPEGVYTAAKGTTEYQKRSVGALHMTIYTSEGTYDEYIGPNEVAGELVAGRNMMIPLERTLIIKGNSTNISLFSPDEALNVETTEDWNYVIEYIDNHYRDFGNESNWKTPNVVIKDGVTIKVDKDHNFPEYAVKYAGKAALKLTDPNGDYKINPKYVILDAENRPTIEVAEETAKITLKDINSELEGEDGTDVTKAIKLVSNGTVVVEGTVDFEALESNGTLTVTEEAEANIKTGAEFVNNGDATIKAEAALNIAAGAEGKNNGNITINVNGALAADGSFTNGTLQEDKTYTEAEIVIRGSESTAINESDRAKAVFADIENNATITIQKGGTNKGTYGGSMKVTGTLTNGVNGVVNDNGELVVYTLANSGKVNLQSDPYALIQVTKGTATVVGSDGSIVLEDATQYEMFETYYTKQNILENVEGVIETTLDQTAYDKVMANLNTYADQENAWEILNKVTLDGAVTLEKNDENVGIDIVIADGASLAGVDLTVKSIVMDGNSGIVGEKKKPTKVSVADSVRVNAGAVAEIGNYTTIMTAVSENNVIKIAGTLTNNGYIDTKDSETLTPNNIYTIIEKGGELINKGQMSSPASRQYPNDTENFGLVEDIINQLGSTLKGTAKTGAYRVEVNKNSYSWNGDLTAETEITPTLLKSIASGTWTSVEDKGYYGLCYNKNKVYYALYLNTGTNSVMPEDVKNFQTEAREKTSKANRSMFIQIAENVANETPYTYTSKTWFNISNNGTLDLSAAADDAQVWAYGESKESSTAVKKGHFNNEE